MNQYAPFPGSVNALFLATLSFSDLAYPFAILKEGDQASAQLERRRFS
jgi:hypothetical protein